MFSVVKALLLTKATFFIKKAVKTVILKYYFDFKQQFVCFFKEIFKMQFIPVMQSWIFSIITAVSHDPSEIILVSWFTAQETFIIINNLYIYIYIYIYIQCCLKVCEPFTGFPRGLKKS